LPDDDRFPRGLPPRWRAVSRCLHRGEPAERARPHVVRALAQLLRQAVGIPDLPQLAADLHAAACARTDELDLAVAPSVLSAPASGHPLSSCAWRVARVMLATDVEVLAAEGRHGVAQRLSLETLHELALSQGLDRIVPQLVRNGRYGEAEALSVVERCLSGPSLAKLAERLLRHPDGVGLVSPSSRQRRSTAELLHIPVRRP
jgi:hypothetical protein